PLWRHQGRVARQLSSQRPMAQRGDAGLMGLLFEKHPPQGLGLRQGRRRPVGRASGQVVENGVGLGDEDARAWLEDRDGAARIHPEKVWSGSLAGENVHPTRLVRCPQVRQEKADFVAILGRGIVVQVHGLLSKWEGHFPRGVAYRGELSSRALLRPPLVAFEVPSLASLRRRGPLPPR